MDNNEQGLGKVLYNIIFQFENFGTQALTRLGINVNTHIRILWIFKYTLPAIIVKINLSIEKYYII